MIEVSRSPPQIHLLPRSHAWQRLWYVGCGAIDTRSERDTLHLNVCQDDHRSFASIVSILAQLQCHVGKSNGLACKVTELLDGAGSVRVASQLGSHAQLMTDPVTYALMRRISRESVYTARTIDAAAKLINELIGERGDVKTVLVDNVDRLDRLSLKILARAMLLLRPEHGFAWAWRSASDPMDALDVSCDGDFYLVSRHAFLQKLLGVISPTLRRSSGVTNLARPSECEGGVEESDISTALVMQNYDACFLWCTGGLSPPSVPEGHRLIGLALTNIDQYDEALGAWRTAECLTTDRGRRAHLCYLQGLLEAKRRYDLTGSDMHYLRGLDEVSRIHDDETISDLNLEHAWLLNGLALNQALLWRRTKDTIHFHRAFDMERQAFDLVRDGTEPARLYLRFNLLANLSFLLEISGRYDVAIQTLNRAFDMELGSGDSAYRMRSTLGYRIGVLYSRVGHLDRALECLDRAAEQDHYIELWSTHERILRAIGSVALQRRDIGRAEIAFQQGLDICRAERSAEGTWEHGRGLATTLLLQGARDKALDVIETLLNEEGLQLMSASACRDNVLPDTLQPSPPSPKLPAYIAEIDLEGIPRVDLNRFLGGAMPANAFAEPWKN